VSVDTRKKKESAKRTEEREQALHTGYLEKQEVALGPRLTQKKKQKSTIESGKTKQTHKSTNDHDVDGIFHVLCSAVVTANDDLVAMRGIRTSHGIATIQSIAHHNHHTIAAIFLFPRIVNDRQQ